MLQSPHVIRSCTYIYSQPYKGTSHAWVHACYCRKQSLSPMFDKISISLKPFPPLSWYVHHYSLLWCFQMHVKLSKMVEIWGSYEPKGKTQMFEFQLLPGLLQIAIIMSAVPPSNLIESEELRREKPIMMTEKWHSTQLQFLPAFVTIVGKLISSSLM